MQLLKISNFQTMNEIDYIICLRFAMVLKKGKVGHLFNLENQSRSETRQRWKGVQLEHLRKDKLSPVLSYSDITNQQSVKSLLCNRHYKHIYYFRGFETRLYTANI